MAQTNGATNPVVSLPEYWKTTIGVCEAAVRLLAVFENQDNYLVESAIKPLRKLVGHGRSLDDMRAFRPTEPAPPKPYYSQRKIRRTVQLDYNPRENWVIVDSSTVQIRVRNGSLITAKTISTVQELDDAMPTIRASPCLALDCEFLGHKKGQPELQVLQIAVSSTLGYAILVNPIGADAIYKRLGSILGQQQPNQLLIGWAFRADALAIEAFVKKIEVTRALDLQAKMKSVAVEQLNLATCIERYCSDWDALEEFTKAKQLGDTFQFLGPDCVWLQNPLPPEAIVYSIFDVVSLVALHERTKNLPTDANHYWPETVISTLSRKGLERLHRTRVMARAETPQQSNGGDTLALIEAPSSKKAGKTKAALVGDFDWEEKYQADMEEAIRRSKEEVVHINVTDERVIGTLDEAGGSGTNFESIEYDSIPHDTRPDSPDGPVFEDPEDLHFADDIYDDSAQKNKRVDQLGGWGDEAGDSIDWPTAQKPPPPPPPSTQQPQPSQYNNIAQAYNQHAQGEYEWDMRPEEKSWNSFAQQSKSGWKGGVDATADWKKMEKVNEAPSPHPVRTTKFQTSVNYSQLRGWAHDDTSGWDKEEERPTSMNMPINQIPRFKPKGKQKIQKGPRVVNPFDIDISDDDDDDDDDEEDDDISSSDESKAGSSTKGRVPEIEDTYRDDLYLDNGDTIHMHLIESSAQLPTLYNVPLDRPLTAIITTHIREVPRRDSSLEHNLKALQIYLSTGESYTILVDRVANGHNEIRDSVLGRILTDPGVTRAVWGLHIVHQQVIDYLGFEMGATIDLALAFSSLQLEIMGDVMQEVIKDRVLLDQVQEILRKYHAKSKFSGSPFDEERLAARTLHYSAVLGWVGYALYEYVQDRPLQLSDFCLPNKKYVA